jgi:hypothetical protein
MCPGWTLKNVARLEGFEPPTPCFGGTCSIHLSYRRVVAFRKKPVEICLCEEL